MSQRIRSEFGPLAARVAGPEATVGGRHVYLQADDGTWRPALLAGWHRLEDGWYGLVTWTQPTNPRFETGLIPAGRLQPVSGGSPQ